MDALNRAANRVEDWCTAHPRAAFPIVLGVLGVLAAAVFTIN